MISHIMQEKRCGTQTTFRTIGLTLALTIAPIVWFQATASAQSSAERASMKTAKILVEKAHGAIANTGLSEAQRLARLEKAIRQTFAFSIWETFLLGKNEKKLSAKQKSEFRRLLPKYLAKLYLKQFGKGLRNKPEIGKAKTIRKDVLVRARIPRANGGSLPVDWRMRNVGKGYRVIDFMVGGTSFLVLKRAEFNTVISRAGADKLNGFLRKFIAS